MQVGENRSNISTAVADVVRAMIVDGRLADGERINEVRLAEQLAVSRTPLREALSRLSAEGALTSVARIGYFVRALTAEEFLQVYAIRPLLDPEALRLAGLPNPKKLDRLEWLNQKLRKAKSREAAVAIDDKWHRELIGDCPNRVLLEVIETMILRTKRFELVLLAESFDFEAASGEHAEIIAALRAGDLDAGCAALRKNMQSGLAPIAARLAQRTTIKPRARR